jgi:hypothetical protein
VQTRHARRLLAITAVTLIVLAAVSPPAAASSDLAPPDGEVSRTSHDAAVTRECWGGLRPFPQLDTSSPRRIHVGGRIDCSYTDTGLWFTINMYSIVGTGDNEHRVFEQQFKHPKTVGSYIGRSFQLACIGTTSTRWIPNIYAGTDGIGNLLPYPSWGPVYTFACGAG